MSYLPDDIMDSVISCETAKATWADLVHSVKGPLDTKENKIMDLKLEYQTFRAKPTESLSQTYTRYKTLLNELANDGVNLSKHEINVGFVNSLPEKWLTFSQRLRNANHTQTLDLADIYGMFVYEDNLIQKSQADPKIQKDYKAEYKKMKAKVALLETNPSTSQTLETFQPKNKGLVAETFNWDEEEVSDDEEVTQVKLLMALADDELTVVKNHARNGEWIDITMRKCRDELLVLKQAKLDAVTFQIQSTELTMLNHALQEQLKVEKKINEKWLTSSKKNKGLVVETFDWDEEEVLDDEEVTEVKVLIALADDELSIRKNHSRNGE
nr:retrovirus-related Pol polyprotein from transposon TNT 1-94 [Tanacetum cinerariifolium]